MQRIIQRITTSGTTSYVGLDADDHLDRLHLEIKPVNYGDDEPDFVQEVLRKLEKCKPKQKD